MNNPLHTLFAEETYGKENKCLMQIMNWKSQKIAKNWEKYVKWFWKYREIKRIGIELSMSFLLTFYVWKRGG